ncbi:MAG: DUF4214 domain-containing protein [Anaerolineaceae bacterium]|nr:DUF4214 domain-containing protein [Anaerolineaceae bacterium]
MKKITVPGLAILMLVAQISSVFAIENRRAIQWNARPVAFVRSLYIGVLGRQPENAQVVLDWARNVNNSSRSRLNVFWGFVGSPEYNNSNRTWAGLSKEWLVIRTRESKVVPGMIGSEACNCYYVTKSPRHGQEVLDHTKFTYPVAKAVLNYYAIFDIDTCPGDCGASRASSPAGAPLPPGPAPAPLGGTAPNPNQPARPHNNSQSYTKQSCSSVVGKWQWFDGNSATFSSDGTMGGNPIYFWRCNGINPVRVTVNWNNKGIDKLTLSPDGNRLEGKNQYGTKIWGTRVKRQQANRQNTSGLCQGHSWICRDRFKNITGKFKKCYIDQNQDGKCDACGLLPGKKGIPIFKGNKFSGLNSCFCEVDSE